MPVAQLMARTVQCRTPQGVRGLKYAVSLGDLRLHASHPARGAWIEITPKVNTKTPPPVAPRKGCVD